MTNFSRWTEAVRTGLGVDPTYGAVVPPLYLSSNYAFEELGRAREYDYSRSGNPTRDLLNDAINTLEGGAGATTVTTGLAGVTLIAEAFVPTGGRVVVQHDAYGGTWRLFTFLASQGRLDVTFVDFNDDDAFATALDGGVAMVWIETPSNPLLRITDIRRTADLAHAAGALVTVDNTFLSPLLQRPLEHGADLVLHSTTKFINGHSDVVGGAVVAATPEHHEKLRQWANALGLTSSAFDAFLTLRGLRTLDARLRIHGENAAALVDAIQDHPAVGTLYWPGLPSHPGHEVAKAQQSGFGSLISVELAGGRAAVERFLDGLEIFHLAESLGGVESLICHPASMTHAGMTDEARATAGISDGLLRISVGVEGRDDLVAVATRALDRAT
ncbi:cystathionine gamma-synthase [Tessaracoccus sp. ZS01]|uniref:cystathionine gamma-synthase n=1 Tax=Tessaracoccus sp. ZS01 TaxID=1906324 RepID=UPI00096C8921|nr:cystathionine gamma-synthase [Tessaracoccus sp. ZS01]MCG6568591.1 O-succinylhomoserine (thiol)-lyase [Tessaracoccus sp. ZS01]OMG52260.1 O-succinylhomoserine (thiol)-lyase [Tessaracoccus sp. ZS01]